MGIHTFSEQTTRLSAQLYSLTGDLSNARYNIADIGDYLPGSILINDMQLLQNLYMSNSGCRILQREKEELQQMGATYFDEFFEPAEVEQLLQLFFSMAAAKDCKKVHTYFQRVRPNKKADWKWFFVSCQLLPDRNGFASSSIILMAQDAGSLEVHQKQIEKILPSAPLSDIDLQKLATLTKREKEILGLIAKGYTSQQIADMLFVAVFTVETHRKNIKQKLSAKSTTDLIRFAILFDL